MLASHWKGERAHLLLDLPKVQHFELPAFGDGVQPADETQSSHQPVGIGSSSCSPDRSTGVNRLADAVVCETPPNLPLPQPLTNKADCYKLQGCCCPAMAHLYPGSFATGLSSRLRCVSRGSVHSGSRSCSAWRLWISTPRRAR